MKKIISSVLAIMMLAGVLSSCSPKGSQQGGGINTNAKYPASEKATTLTFFCYDGEGPFNNDYPVFKKAAEFTNVTLKGTIAKSVSDENQAFNTMLSSGDLAHIVLYNKDEFNKYGAEGVFIPLNDLIEQYAPNLKKFLDENKDVKKYITSSDGNIYYIPFVPEGDTGKVWFIREDWLNELGLKAPKSVDEFYNVLTAFKDKDPNKNGKNDEVPYFNRLKQEGVHDLYILWGAYPSWSVKDGKVKYGPIEPEFKEANKNLAKWYNEKLIDIEIYARGNNARELFLGDNTGGVTHDWLGSTATFNDEYQKSNPNFKFTVMAPPSGVETSRREKLRPRGWGLTSQNPDPVAGIKYFDFWFTEEGRRLMNFGVEGEQYTMVDGHPKFTNEVLNAGKPVLDILRAVGAQLNTGYLQDFNYERQWLNQIALDGVDLYVNNNYLEAYPVFLRSTEQDKRYVSLITAIETYRDEITQKWMLGVDDIDATWDKYINEMKRLKIDELIQIQQEAYDRYVKD